jgi:hypothetical protein
MTNVQGIWAAIAMMVLWLSAILYFMFRNHLVYNLRIKMVKDYGLEKYFKLPSYDYMLYHFWIPLRKWSIHKGK